MAHSDLFARIQTLRAGRDAHAGAAASMIGRRVGRRVDMDGHWLTGFCSRDALGPAQPFAGVGAFPDAVAGARVRVVPPTAASA